MAEAEAEAEAEAKVEAKAELELKLGQAPTLRLLNFVAKFQDKASYCLPNNGDDVCSLLCILIYRKGMCN